MYCDYGCNQEALYILKNKKNCCASHSSKCPEMKKKNSNGCKKAYITEKRISQKEVYKNIPQNIKDKMAWNRNKTILDLNEVFKEKSSTTREYSRKIILKEKLLDYSCQECHIISWRNEKLYLELDHINGVNSDHRLENLRFLCPNCHSQTSTFRGRGQNTGKIKVSDEELVKSLSTSSNVDTALRSVGLSTGPGNYKRIVRLMKQFNINMPGWE